MTFYILRLSSVQVLDFGLERKIAVFFGYSFIAVAAREAGLGVGVVEKLERWHS